MATERRRAVWRRCCLTLAAPVLGGCVLQPPAQVALPPAPAAWSAAPDAAPATPAHADWWRALHDPALDALIADAERDAPTLDQAAARILQARAALAGADAGTRPTLGGSLQATRGTSTISFPVAMENQASAALSPGWEIDLFGRLRHNRAGARARLDAQVEDARLARLTLQTQIADTLLQRRACALTEARLRDTVQSSETTLALTRIKRDAGFAAPLDEARSRTSVGEARGTLVSTSGQCRQLTQSLADLAGLDAAGVETRLAEGGALANTPMPIAPALRTALPAAVLAGHPSLIAARRNADAAFEDIGGARAARLPSLNLSALLGTSWIQIGQIDQGINNWSLGATLAGTLYDGGAGAAQVDAAQGRYQEALALLRQTLRDTVRDVELALLAGASARDGEREATATVAAAEDLFRASEAAQQAGRLSLFDLETARSALLAAQSTLIAAQRDRARAWVALIKSTANPLPPAADAGAPVGAAP